MTGHDRITITTTGTSHDHSHESHLSGHNHVAGQGPTVLDIGDDVGALVLYTSAELVGAEIEISPDGEPDRRRHVAVHPREIPGGTTMYAAVYYGLAAGTLRPVGGGWVARVDRVDRRQRDPEAVWPQGVLAPR